MIVESPAGIVLLALGASVLVCACDPGPASIDELLRDGRYAEAENVAAARLDALEAASRRDDLETARILDQLVLAMFRGGKGHLPEAMERAERALNIKTSLLPPDDPELAVSLDNYGGLHSFRGDYEDARRYHERALKIREDALGSDSYEASLTLNYLAPLLYLMGDYAAASPLYERALAIRIRQLGPDHPRVAGVLNNMGMLAYDMGDDQTARTRFERALAIREAKLDAKHPRVASALNNLACVNWRGGDYEEAKRLALRALEIKRAALSHDDADLGDTLDLLGSIEHSMGNFEAARERYEEAIAIMQTSLRPDHPTVALSLYGLAGTLHASGELDQAKELFRSAASTWGDKLGPSHPFTAASKRGLAAVLFDLGQDAACMAASLRAEQSSREHLRLTARAFAEGTTLRYAAARVSGLNLALSLLADGREIASVNAVADAVFRSRALVLDELVARRQALSDSSDPEIEARRERLSIARARLANLLVRGVSGDAERVARQIELARQNMEHAEQDLARASAPFRRELALSAIGLNDVLEKLPPASALVSFVRYDRHVPGTADTTAAYTALVIRAAGDVFAVELGRAERIENLIEAWRAEAANPWAAGDEGGEAADVRYARVGTAVREAIWDPLARRLADAELVFVVPDGALHTVNLATLPAGDGTFLVESDTVLHYLSAERDLVFLQQPGVSGAGLLAVGNPDFDGRIDGEANADTSHVGRPTRWDFYGRVPGECAALASVHFESLPGSATELAGIAEMWGRLHQDVVLATGPRADEATFKHQAPGKRVVHLATHGFFLNDECRPARPGTRGLGAVSTAKDIAPPTPLGENPLVLAGLAFAGANRRGEIAGEGEDGILTAEEITAMDLRGVEWVVLSACDTGLGEIREGEGVLGLRRAFQLAGARSLIMSLWSVEDASTSRWMTALYRARLDGRSTAQAVREASVESLQRRRLNAESTHPFFWGAFVATGGWS